MTGREPVLTDRERLELRLLAAHYGLSADEVMNVRPAWEINNLIAGLVEEVDADG